MEPREKTYFEQQREALIGEIAMSFEHVLANINKLNRSLEAVIAVGNEFSSVEALWSQFENVMAKDEDGPRAGEGQQRQEEEQHHDDDNDDNDDSHLEGEAAAEDEDEEMDEDITIK